MELLVAIDVDECLLRWLPSFDRYVSLRKWKSVPVETWDLAQRYPDHHPEQIRSMIEEFHHSYDYERLPEMPHASETLQDLKEDFPHVRFIAVSACGRTAKTLQARKWQLRNFPIDDLMAVDIGASKAKVYNQLQPDIVIDDHVDHLVAAASMGMTPIAFDQPWNRGAGFPAILSWKHAHSFLAPYLRKEANQ